MRARTSAAAAAGTPQWNEADLSGGDLTQPSVDVFHATTTWAADGSTIVLDAGVQAITTNISRRMVSIGTPAADCTGVELCLVGTPPGGNPNNASHMGLLLLVSNDDGTGAWSGGSAMRVGLVEDSAGNLNVERPRDIAASQVQDTAPDMSGRARMHWFVPLEGSTVNGNTASVVVTASGDTHAPGAFQISDLSGTAAPLYVGLGAMQEDSNPTAGTPTWADVRLFWRWLVDPEA